MNLIHVTGSAIFVKGRIVLYCVYCVFIGNLFLSKFFFFCCCYLIYYVTLSYVLCKLFIIL